MAALFQHPSILELLRSLGKKPAPGKTPPKPTPVADIKPLSPPMARMQGTLLTSQPTSPRKTMLGS